jgi:hypothetical protein
MNIEKLILSVLYGCETWSLTLTEERICLLWVSENRVLRGIFGTKRENKREAGRNLCN